MTTREPLSAGDVGRYAFLALLGSMVFLVVYDDRPGALPALVGTWAVVATAVAVVVRLRHRAVAHDGAAPEEDV